LRIVNCLFIRIYDTIRYDAYFYRATPCYRGICRSRVSVCVSQVGVLLKRLNHRITQTTPHDSPDSSFPMPKISAKLKRRHLRRRRQMQVGRLKFATFDK